MFTILPAADHRNVASCTTVISGITLNGAVGTRTAQGHFDGAGLRVIPRPSSGVKQDRTDHGALPSDLLIIMSHYGLELLFVLSATSYKCDVALTSVRVMRFNRTIVSAR
eukprot:CAMPEP_0182561002 /NCGR_PEP_ID=MMETSP1324-20130603/3555_1 /TAXON_ID=236786 /ORGANISM="Florenciella sp., Strain RCC1587" /LENGTH=109 /DNA_ID=CAMNT_0024773493 /DNA_START=140 /DNA_END=469 /DNA_ORIENTATION=+